jgi:glyoxylase-like metal-dependent hydrolase (beta-lactamase superfamily II)
VFVPGRPLIHGDHAGVARRLAARRPGEARVLRRAPLRRLAGGQTRRTKCGRPACADPHMDDSAQVSTHAC